ncbi:MAG: S8 family serine peptidase [Clostridiales Family XIII bacterium]|jgi:hypothetical protein|nr:S8 family serine peptidase [Clostridiales Family XIII bacterium]
MRLSKKIPALIFAIVLLFPAFPAPVFADVADGADGAGYPPDGDQIAQTFAVAEETGDCVEGEMLVVFKENVGEPAAENAVETVDGEILDLVEFRGEESLTALVELPKNADAGEAAEALAQNPAVDFVQPNYIYRLADGEEILPAFASADPFTPYSWHLDSINLTGAWNTLAALAPKAPVRVAVLDNNVYLDHEDFAGSVNKDLSRDLITGVPTSPNTANYEIHGTHVTGILGAVANNNKGVAGVAGAPIAQGGKSIAEIIPINVFSNGGATTYIIADALDYAVSVHAKVINMSLGFKSYAHPDTALGNAVSRAVSSGATVVCAAGNDLGSGVPYEALPSDYAYPGVISVVNIAQDNRRNSTSNYGPPRDISAPGTGIYSTAVFKNSNTGVFSGSYATMSGTSMASPVVAGVAAMMLYVNGDLSPADVEKILKETATPLDDSTATGGKVNAAAAVQKVAAQLTLAGTVAISGFNGTPRFDQSLTATATSLSENHGTLSYQWKRDGAAIDTATSQDYTVASADIGHSLSVTVTAANYAGGVTSPATYKVVQAAAPSITWPATSQVSYGTSLANVPLSGGSTGFGSFAWVNPSEVPEVGTDSHSVIFTPSADTLANYEQVSATTQPVTLTVNKATLPAGVSRTFYVKAGAARSYDFDLTTLLPDVSGWADVTYNPAITGNASVLNTSFNVSGDTLTLQVLASAANNAQATVQVTISSKNYTDVTSTITVKALNKTFVTITGINSQTDDYTYDGLPKAGYTMSTPVFKDSSDVEISISNPVFKVTYTGILSDSNSTVYADSTTSPSAAGIYSWHLELDDTTYYAELTGSFTIAKASRYPATTAVTAEYGKKLNEITFPVPGFVWKLSPDTPVGGVSSSPNFFAATYTHANDAANYNAVDVDVQVAVTPKPLTVKDLTAVSRVYDGTAGVALVGGSLYGVVPGDEASVGFTLTSATLNDKAPGANKPVNVAGTLTGAGAANYAITGYDTVTVNVLPKPITAEDLNSSSPTKAHDGTDAASWTATLKDGVVVAGDDLRVKLTGHYASANAGSQSVTVTGWSLEGASASYYVLEEPKPSGIFGNISSPGSGPSPGGAVSGGTPAPKAEEEAKEPASASASAEAPVKTITVESKPALDAGTGKVAAAIEAESVITAVEVAKKAATEALEAGKANAVAEVKLTVKSEVVKDASGAVVPVKSAEIGIPAEAVKAVAAAKNLVLTAQSELSTITFDTATVNGVAAAASTGDTIRITSEKIEKTETEDARLLEKAGDSTVIELTVFVGDKPVKSFAGSVTVSLPYSPKTSLKEEDRDLITVYFLGDDGGIQEVKSARYDARTRTVTFTAEHFSKFFVSEWISPFADIEKGDWFYKNARFAYTNGLIGGVSENEFAPLSNLTRAMFVTMLYRSEGSPAAVRSEAFSDVETGQWYADAVAWASANGIALGYGDGRFGTDDPVTREQLAAMLHKLALLKDPGLAKAAELAGYDDADELSPWAAEAAAWANAKGILTGRDARTLAPQGTATRAETAALLQRYIELAG